MNQKITCAIPEDIQPVVKYAVITGTNVRKMSDLKGGEVHTAQALVLGEYLDERTGEMAPFCAIQCDGEVFRTPSPSFNRGVSAFVEFLNPTTPFEFKVVSKMSNSGREYIVFEPIL